MAPPLYCFKYRLLSTTRTLAAVTHTSKVILTIPYEGKDIIGQIRHHHAARLTMLNWHIFLIKNLHIVGFCTDVHTSVMFTFTSDPTHFLCSIPIKCEVAVDRLHFLYAGISRSRSFTVRLYIEL